MDGEPVSFPVMNEGAEEAELHWIERLYRLKSRELLLSPGFTAAQNSLRNAGIAWTYTKRFPSPLEIIPLMETNQFKH
jgi:hypothetical protein